MQHRSCLGTYAFYNPDPPAQYDPDSSCTCLSCSLRRIHACVLCHDWSDCGHACTWTSVFFYVVHTIIMFFVTIGQSLVMWTLVFMKPIHVHHYYQTRRNHVQWRQHLVLSQFTNAVKCDITLLYVIMSLRILHC